MNFTPGYINLTAPVHFLDTVVGRNVTLIVIGITISYINVTMIHTFNKHQIFKLNARYILFIHLVLNDIIQLTTSISLYIVASISNTLWVFVCVLIIIPSILTSQNTPLNLTFMAAECYIAVCMPLRYNYICTVKRTYVVIAVIWTVSFLSILPDVVILLATEPQQFLNSKVFCARDFVFRSPYSLKKREASHILFLVVVWFTLFYTYFRIMFVAKAANADAKKARNTILIHGFQQLLCMMVYVQPVLFQILTFAFPGMVASIYFVLFLMIQVLPRLASPIVYGLRDKTFRMYFIRHIQIRSSGRT